MTINGSWGEDRSAGGVQNGPNFTFAVPSGTANVTFYRNSSTLVPWVTVDTPTPSKRSTCACLKAHQ